MNDAPLDDPAAPPAPGGWADLWHQARAAAIGGVEMLGADLETLGGALIQPGEPEREPEDAAGVRGRFVAAYGRAPTDAEVEAAVRENHATNASRLANYNQRLARSDRLLADADRRAEQGRRDAAQYGPAHGLPGVIGSTLGGALPGLLDTPFAAMRSGVDVLHAGGTEAQAARAAAIEAPVAGIGMALPGRGGQLGERLAAAAGKPLAAVPQRLLRAGARWLGEGAGAVATVPMQAAADRVAAPPGQESPPIHVGEEAADEGAANLLLGALGRAGRAVRPQRGTVLAQHVSGGQRPFDLEQSRAHGAGVAQAELDAGRSGAEARRSATEVEHARMRQMGFDPNEVAALAPPQAHAGAAPPDQRFVLDRDGGRYTQPLFGKLLSTIETVSGRHDDGHYAVMDPNSAAVLTRGPTREAADQAAESLAREKSRRRLQAMLDREPPLSQQQLRHRHQDQYPEARIGPPPPEPPEPSAEAEVTPDSPRFSGARGPSSYREFDPESAGGPIRRRSAEGTQITHEGIDTVERHIARFGQDEANNFMLNRLRSIANGDLKATQHDLNYYTHELTEFERYKNLGWESGQPADKIEAHRLWNNAHTASLEDFGIKDDQLYHPDALK